MLSYCGTFNQDNDNQLDCSVGNTCIAEADCGDICFNRPNVNDCSPETRAIGGTCVEGPGSKAAKSTKSASKSTKSSKGGDKSKASKSSPTFVPTYVVRDYIYCILYYMLRFSHVCSRSHNINIQPTQSPSSSPSTSVSGYMIRIILHIFYVC